MFLHAKSKKDGKDYFVNISNVTTLNQNDNGIGFQCANGSGFYKKDDFELKLIPDQLAFGLISQKL